MSNKTPKELKARCFEVMQHLYHPDHLERDIDGKLTGKLLPEYASDEPLITEEKAIDACKNHASIKRAAIYKHSEDVYTEEDEKKNPKHKAGWDKPTHLHIYMTSETRLSIASIAKWFGVDPQYVEIKKGHGAFLDCLEYGFHESPKAIEQEKTHYDEGAILYTKNCNPRAEVDALQKRIEKYQTRSMTPKQELRMKVMEEGMTIREALKHDPLVAADDLNKLQQLRGVYLTKYAPLPDHRINFYICPRDSEHGSGVGKSLFSRMLARALMPELENDLDIYYEAGSGKSAFQDYDGQPVVIFNDARAGGLLTTFGGRDELFAALDTTPSRKPVDKKFGSTTLVQQYTIINGIQPYRQFMDELAGTYMNASGMNFKAEDVNQAKRRFPFIIRIDEEDFDLLYNMGFFYGTREYEAYEGLNNFRANVRRLIEVYGEHSIESKHVQKQICEPVVEKVEELHEILTPKALPDASEFADYGKQMTDDEAVALKFQNCKQDCNNCRFGVPVDTSQSVDEHMPGFRFQIKQYNPNPYCMKQKEDLQPVQTRTLIKER